MMNNKDTGIPFPDDEPAAALGRQTSGGRWIAALVGALMMVALMQGCTEGWKSDASKAPVPVSGPPPAVEPPAQTAGADAVSPPAGAPVPDAPKPAAAANGGDVHKSAPKKAAKNGAGSGPRPDYATVKVFFATDRNLTSSGKLADRFGAARSQLRYGTCDVSIPRDHRMGELEAPSIWRMEFREDPAKHVVLRDISVQSRDRFFADLRQSIASSAKSSAFIFIHGYNVMFEDAARRTAQITYDLGFDGAPIFYSWPSQGKTTAYMVDEANIEWTQAHLQKFLDEVTSDTGAQNIYLIAHSMGNRALTRALAALLARKPSVASRLREVILTAPDIDAEVFRRDIAPALAQAAPVTLYASSDDLALVASKKVHGYPRAGDAGAGLVVLEGIETIDATGVDTSLLAHSYFAETRSVLADMFYLVREGKRADQRFGLRRVQSPAGGYWKFKR